MSTLSLVVEGNACSWGEMAAKYGEGSINDMIRSIVSFSNSFLSLSSSNKLLLFVYSHGVSEKLIFNSRSDAKNDSSTTMTQRLRESLTADASSSSCRITSPLAAVLSHSICHMKRADNESSKSTGDASNSATQFIDGRVVIISLKPEFGKEHNSLMNLFFAAAKNGICVDVLSLEECSPLLQQAADITSGLFLNIDKPASLLRLMMTHVLADPASRSIFPQPIHQTVDYRAACVCHHKLVNSGWVCSVCLSVLCGFTPICKACGSVFKLSALPKKSAKRKRQE